MHRQRITIREHEKGVGPPNELRHTHPEYRPDHKRKATEDRTLNQVDPKHLKRACPTTLEDCDLVPLPVNDHPRTDRDVVEDDPDHRHRQHKQQDLEKEQFGLVVLKNRLRRKFHADIAQQGCRARTQLIDPVQDPRHVVRPYRLDIKDHEPRELVRYSLVGLRNVPEEGLLRHHDGVVEVVQLVEPVRVGRVPRIPPASDGDVDRGQFSLLLPDHHDAVTHIQADLIETGGSHHRLEVAIRQGIRVWEASGKQLDLGLEVPDEGDVPVPRELASLQALVIGSRQQWQRITLPIRHIEGARDTNRRFRLIREVGVRLVVLVQRHGLVGIA